MHTNNNITILFSLIIIISLLNVIKGERGESDHTFQSSQEFVAVTRDSILSKQATHIQVKEKTITLNSCGDNICNINENCLICPQDCRKCSFKGWKISYFPVTENVKDKAIKPLYSKGHADPRLIVTSKSPLSALWLTYFNLTQGTGNYLFLIHTTNNVGGTVYIDDKEVTTFQFGLTDGDYSWESKLWLSSKLTHKFEVVAYAAEAEHFISISWRKDGSNATFAPFADSFYSLGLCGDGVCNGDETNYNCYIDCARCGDGRCTHNETLRSCFIDCAKAKPYSVLGSRYTNELIEELAKQDEETCDSAYLPGYIATGSDTLGYLLDNQLLYFLPGLEHMLHGIDIVTGKEEILPIFKATYQKCPEDDKIIQDTYRGNWYKIPLEYEADPYPTCSYSTESTFYESSSSMSEEMSSETGVSASLGAGGGAYGFNVAAKLAFSYEQSVSSARSQQSKSSGTLINTEASCLTSRVQLREHNFHPEFLSNLNNCINTAITPAENAAECMSILIDLYGTHYYTMAELGGKLTQVISLATSYVSESDSSSIETSAQASFSASASGWGVSLEASASYSQSQGQNVEHQSAFENSSNKSFILTYGGAPGSFGPSTIADGSSPANWGQWAQTVDLLPIPLNYQLDRVYNLIADHFEDQSVADTWMQGEELYFTKYGDSVRDDGFLLMNEYVVYAFTSKDQAANVGPYAFSITGSFGTTSPAFFIQDIINVDAGIKSGVWPLYEFKAGTMTYIDVILQDVGNIQSLALMDLGNLTHRSIQGDILGAWKPELIWIVDKSRSQVYYFSDFSPIKPDSNYAVVLPQPRSKVIDLLFFASKPLGSEQVIGTISLIGTNNTVKFYFVNGEFPFVPKYKYDSQQQGETIALDVYILSLFKPVEVGRVLFVRGQLAYNDIPTGNPKYSIGRILINYYEKESNIALGNTTRVYTSDTNSLWSPISPLVVTMSSTVPHFNKYCLQYPMDNKCINPLS